MSTIDKIKQDQVTARKARLGSVASLLTTVIGEAEMVGKNAGRSVTEEEVQVVLKKFVKNLDETIAVLGDLDPRTLIAIGEKMTLMNYMPKQLSNVELFVIIDDLISIAPVGAKMGDIMSKLKESYAGLYDGKTASRLIKEILA